MHIAQWITGSYSLICGMLNLLVMVLYMYIILVALIVAVELILSYRDVKHHSHQM